MKKPYKMKNPRMSSFICCSCNKQLYDIPRVNLRERNHIKDLYCPYCKKTVKAREIRQGDFYKTMDGTYL